MQTEDIEENAISLASVNCKNEMTFLDNEPTNFRKNSTEFVDPRMVPESPKSDEDFVNDQSKDSNENIRNWLQRITQIQSEIQRKITSEQNQFPEYSKPSASCNKVVKYQDLPYMGEMTLDNSKPRRGRKPKKADICHLIYKNYGTIYPGTPKNLVEAKKSDKTEVNEVVNRSDVQNKIISSLLERRLTQESKKQRMTPPNQDEPLNLCIRDLNHLKIRLKPNETAVDVKSEPQSDDDVEFVHETPSPCSSSSKDMKFPADLDGKGDSAPGGYVYWPSAGVFIHPMALQQQLMYYQKLAAGNSYTLPTNKPETPPNDIDKKLITTESKRKDDVNEDEQKIKRNAPSTSSSSDKTPMKRKRSAIFIPPIPAENQTNPATEVSICKFKFTGGAKPSLQEKKMLSVDSGGNFTYYSGTGDKSMRGYEFFPRQTLQQQISTQGSSTGAFLQVSGEKIFPTSPSDLTPKPPQNEFVLTPEVQPPQITLQDLGPRNKKRKSRKSLQREKLEQTFKEKGFLIQTQQLESAEGATYCKFRQLRKFTRYLFRSWKDYLPGMANEEENRRIAGTEESNDNNDVDLENSLSNSDLNTELNN